MTQRHFLDEGVFEAIGRDDVEPPNLYLFSQSSLPKGIHANMSFIETESGHFKVKPLRIY